MMKMKKMMKKMMKMNLKMIVKKINLNKNKKLKMKW